MDANLVALKLVLDGLGETDDISVVQDRMRIQKAIYLTQVVGINLGYSYSWYIKGPYSTGLTQDYYQLAEERAAGVQLDGRTQLNPVLQPHLQRARELLQKPAHVPLQKPQWYELLASLHFLLKSAGYSFEKAAAHLKQYKPHLQGCLEAGRDHLKQFGLI